MAGRKRKGIIIGAIAVVLAAGAALVLRPRPAAVSERQYAARLLAEYLKSAARPKAVLVIGNPFARLPGRPAQVYTFEKAGVAGLIKGFEGVTVVPDAPRLKREVIEHPGEVGVDPRSATPLSFMVESSAFDDLVKAHPECDVVVSLIGVPVNLSSFNAWVQEGGRRFGLLLPDWRMIGDAKGIQSAFNSGKLAAAVVAKPGAPGTAANEDRYILVQSNNVARVLREFPQIFAP